MALRVSQQMENVGLPYQVTGLDQLFTFVTNQSGYAVMAITKHGNELRYWVGFQTSSLAARNIMNEAKKIKSVKRVTVMDSYSH